MADKSPYAGKPWLAQYTPGLPYEIKPTVNDVLSLFREAVRRAPDRPAAIYFDGTTSYAELDALSDAVAAALIDRGFSQGDRLAVYLQNIPQFLIAVLATWKAGGIVVPVNPMYREHELTQMFADSTPKVLICLDTLYRDVIAILPPDTVRPAVVITTSASHMQSRNDSRIFDAGIKTDPLAPEAGFDLLELAKACAGRTAVASAAVDANTTAFLVYTSGTTGVPKAAMNSHGNVSFNAHAIARWYSLEDGDAILALAPLFHVTGLVAHVAMSWRLAAPLILCCRFEPGVVLDALAEHKPAWTVSAITAFIALMNHKESSPSRYASLKVVVSGGAPISPSVVEEFRRRTGRYIHNGYGLTETNAGVIAVPHLREAPVDGASGALAIGVPKFNVEAWIADESGVPATVGTAGEIVISSPSVVPGYWRKPAETAESMRASGFRTGDVGFMDAEGWFYLVDRKKDVIIASGFKVWPREVEDVLYAHPAVREAAVVGVRDAYRGENVKAVVSLKADATVTAQELIEWCQQHIATYKRPRQVEIIDDLPKTVTGKILRRMLK